VSYSDQPTLANSEADYFGYLQHVWDEPTPTPTVELRMDFVFIPLWLLVALAMLPTLAGRIRTAMARRLWARRGMCLNCGYDLRGTPDRCPECGTVPAAKLATAA